MSKVELLAPAGSLEAFYASINAGADAIYLGGKNFSARAFADNFDDETIYELIRYAHLHEVKVYITINTIMFEDEIEGAMNFIEGLYNHDVDGILLQDIGLASLVHHRFKDLVIHASTQLNCHNVSEAKALIDLGFSRIVLAREASIDLVKDIKALGVEVEAFIHGALCVSYSGNCLMSSLIGNRSGNRGKCAQPCRNKMNVVGKNFESNDFAISTKDLNTLEYIDKLIEAGIDSLKIEGRMKRKEYVYQVVSSYRKGIDAYFDSHIKFNPKEETNKINHLFSRNNTKGYIFNESRTNLLNQDTSSHQGSHLGKVIFEKNGFIYIELDDDLSLNDGIRFNNKLQTGQLVQKMKIKDKEVTYAKKGTSVAIKKYNVTCYPGDEVIKTTDNKQLDEISKVIDKEKKLPIDIYIKAYLDKKLVIRLKYLDYVVTHESDYIVQYALNRDTDENSIKEQISKLGNTEFVSRIIEIQKDDNIFIPVKALNDLRRDAVSKLEELIVNRNHYDLTKDMTNISSKVVSEESFHLDVQVEDEDQLLEVMNYPYKRIYIQNNALYEKYKNQERIYHALYRINDVDTLEALDKEVIPYLKRVNGKDVTTSPYFYICNSYALDYIYSLGYNNVILSYELSKDRINLMMKEYLLRHDEYPNVSIPLYGHIDLMIMKSCPIATSLGIKKDHCNMCKNKEFVLSDRFKETFKMMHDENCVTRILNTYPLYLLDKIEEIRDNHISSGVIYFTNESKDIVNKISSDAFSILEGETIKNDTKQITRGHYLKKID